MRQALPIYEKVRRAPSLEPDRPRPMVARAGGGGGGTPDGQSTSLAQQVGSQNTLRVRICADSGMLATPYCPHVVSREYLSGQQPAERCTMHKKPAEAPHAKPRRTPVAHSGQGYNGDDATPHRRWRHRRQPPSTIDQPALETNGPDSAGDDAGTSAATEEVRPRRHRRHHTRAPSPDGDNGGDTGNGGTDQ